MPTPTQHPDIFETDYPLGTALELQPTNRDRVTQIDDALVLLGVPEMIEEARRTIDLLAVAQRLEDTPPSSDGAGGTVLWWLEQPTERGSVVMGVMVTFGDPAYVAWQVAANPRRHAPLWTHDPQAARQALDKAVADLGGPAGAPKSRWIQQSGLKPDAPQRLH